LYPEKGSLLFWNAEFGEKEVVRAMRREEKKPGTGKRKGFSEAHLKEICLQGGERLFHKFGENRNSGGDREKGKLHSIKAIYPLQRDKEKKEFALSTRGEEEKNRS